MPNAKFRNYLHLHFIVFIWGFTAVLGRLISIDALPLVWYRMSIASLLILCFLGLKKYALRVPKKTIRLLFLAGIIIALHWVTFFKAIKVSNVSVVLATLSTGAFFTAILEPIWYKRRFIWYELAFGLLVMLGLFIIFRVESQFLEGILLALVSAILASMFTLINGKLIMSHKPSVISFYELLTGVLVLSVYLILDQGFTADFFILSKEDWGYLFILASVCTAYAFIASVKVMKYISPYTVMLTTNLEPVYGIILAFVIIGDSEKMGSLFYLGACLIMVSVIANGILKNRRKLKS